MSHFFKSNIKSSEITPEQVYLSRRKLLKVGATGLGAMAAMGTLAACSGAATPAAKPAQAPSGQTAASEVAPVAKASADELGDKLNSYKEITNYNNYYEFSTDKEEVAVLTANYAPPAPFKVEVTGLVGKAMTFDLDDLKKKFGEEERVYRLRCVEGWSMVIPWLGFSLAGLLKAVEPTSAAKFVRFYSHHDSNMPGNSLDWPYVEGLRLDEAMNELALMATGLYGKALPVQNGAPVRLALPWKYGFKSIKAVTKIELVAEQPVNTWKAANAGEYGFYSNVNPNRPHPRWTQANERRIGESGRRATLLFNGYEKQVASLYAGMDLVQEY
jgi:methionine sulfoxide reductase catalytic subunit